MSKTTDVLVILIAAGAAYFIYKEFASAATTTANGIAAGAVAAGTGVGATLGLPATIYNDATQKLESLGSSLSNDIAGAASWLGTESVNYF